MAFTLRDIPATMRKEGWQVGANLMDHWLQARAWTMPDNIKSGNVSAPTRAIETRLVKMQWLLSFGRAATADRRLLDTWASQQRLGASTIQIERQFRKCIGTMKPAALVKPFRFGDLGRSVPWINENCAINIERVDSPWYNATDDLYAALGRALVKIEVSGMAKRDGRGWTVTIDQVGTFMRDTYDFNGDQSLGSWGPSGFSRMAVASLPIEVDWRKKPTFWQRQHEFFTVNNQSFRDYRNTFGMGGDFLLFSDLRRTALPRPVIVRFAA